MTDQLTEQLQDAVATLAPSDRLRRIVLDIQDEASVPLAASHRGRRNRTAIALTVGVAVVGVTSAAAAAGLFAHPDPIDAAAVKHLPSEGAYSAHMPGWRPELAAERYRCSGGPGQDHRGWAASGPLEAALDADGLITDCERAVANVPGNGRAADGGPAIVPAAEDPKICEAPFAVDGIYAVGDLPKSTGSEDRFIAVVLDRRTCEEAGFTTTDPAELLAIVNDRRARETKFLARFATGTCLTAHEALRIAENHLADLAPDFTTWAQPRGDEQICFQPQISWEHHNAMLFPTQERPGPRRTGP